MPLQLLFQLVWNMNIRGVIDLIKMKALPIKQLKIINLTEEEIPADLWKWPRNIEHELIEKVSEFDDEALNKFLGRTRTDEADLKRAIRKGVISGKFFPIFGGDNRTAEAQLLLDGVVEYLPSPLDFPPVEGINPKTGEKEKRERKMKKILFSACF